MTRNIEIILLLIHSRHLKMAAPAESGDQSESFPEGADGDLQAYYDQDPV